MRPYEHPIARYNSRGLGRGGREGHGSFILICFYNRSLIANPSTTSDALNQVTCIVK